MNQATLFPLAFALLLSNSATAQDAVPPSRAPTTEHPANSSAEHGPSRDGTYEAPYQWSDHSDTVGAIYAIHDATGRKRFYESKFVGVPADTGHELPPLPDGYDDFSFASIPAVQNEFWLYRGTHAGTYADPKINCEASYTGAINRLDKNDGETLFFRTSRSENGSTCLSSKPPYGPTSSEDWEFLNSTKKLGTFDHPKGDQTVEDFTWKGAIHVFTMADGTEAFYASKQDGKVSSSWTPPQKREDTEHWKFVADRTNGVHAGTYEDPKPLEERSNAVDSVYATFDAKGTRRFYSARFVGYPADRELAFPPLPDSYQDFPNTTVPAVKNEFWVYRGTHAGTYADPKINCEATYPGAINRIEVDPTLPGSKTYAFFRTDYVGYGDTCWTPLPTLAQSVEGWTYLNSTSRLGTLSDPKGDETVADFTWEGAIHVFHVAWDYDSYVESRQDGMVTPQWTAPDPVDPQDTEHWKLLARRKQATFEHPALGLGSAGLAWVGAVYSFPVDGQPSYFLSRFEGDESTVQPSAPTAASSNEFFTYVGPIDSDLGSLAHPKGWHDPTWPGQIHAFNLPNHKVYYEAQFEGIPSARYQSLDEIQADSEHWIYKGESRHAGSYVDPKTLDDLTWPGAIHKRDGYFDGSSTVTIYYRSTFHGIASAQGIGYPQDGLQSDKQWTFLGVSMRAGTFESPKDETEVTWRGAIHASHPTAGSPRNFFISKVEGPAPMGGRPFPAKGQSNDDWTYIGTDDHKGTFVDPKTERDFTWPGAIHMIDEKARLRFFASTFYGAPPLEEGWIYPKEGSATSPGPT